MVVARASGVRSHLSGSGAVTGVDNYWTNACKWVLIVRFKFDFDFLDLLWPLAVIIRRKRETKALKRKQRSIQHIVIFDHNNNNVVVGRVRFRTGFFFWKIPSNFNQRRFGWNFSPPSSPPWRLVLFERTQYSTKPYSIAKRREKKRKRFSGSVRAGGATAVASCYGAVAY